MRRSTGMVALGLAALVVAGAGPAWALDEVPTGWSAPVRFGLVGLARGQTARLSIVAVGGGNPDPSGTSCVASLRFLDAGGKPFVDPNGGPVATQPVPLLPGQAVSLDLSAAVAFGQSLARRVAFQAAGDITSYVDPELVCPKPVATLEVFDNLTGRTQVLYPSDPELFPKSDVAFPNDPEILRLGMMGLARGQTARLSVLAVDGGTQLPPSPCTAMLGFVDAAGQAFTDANGNVIAAPFEGKTTELDLRGADAFRGSLAMRQGIRATVGIIDPDLSCTRPLVTVEIFDVLTGRTQVLYPTDPEI